MTLQDRKQDWSWGQSEQLEVRGLPLLGGGLHPLFPWWSSWEGFLQNQWTQSSDIPHNSLTSSESQEHVWDVGQFFKWLSNLWVEEWKALLFLLPEKRKIQWLIPMLMIPSMIGFTSLMLSLPSGTSQCSLTYLLAPSQVPSLGVKGQGWGCV